jgi:hypothetical protein
VVGCSVAGGKNPVIPPNAPEVTDPLKISVLLPLKIPNQYCVAVKAGVGLTQKHMLNPAVLEKVTADCVAVI